MSRIGIGFLSVGSALIGWLVGLYFEPQIIRDALITVSGARPLVGAREPSRQSMPKRPLQYESSAPYTGLVFRPQEIHENCLSSTEGAIIDTQKISEHLRWLEQPADADPKSLLEALPLLGLYGTEKAKTILQELVRTHQDPDVREAAIQAIRDKNSAEALLAALEDPVPSVRENSVRRMLDIEESPEDRFFEAQLKKRLVLEEDPDVLGALLDYFDYHTTDPGYAQEIAQAVLVKPYIPSFLIHRITRLLNDYEVQSEDNVPLPADATDLHLPQEPDERWDTVSSIFEDDG